MKKIIPAILALSLLAGCASNAVIDKKEYTSYGLLNADTNRNPDLEYRIVMGNVFWSIILIETVVFPVYFIGFSLYEPVGKRTDSDKGRVR